MSNTYLEEDEIDLIEVLKIIFKYRIIIILSIIVSISFGILYSFFSKQIYKMEAIVSLNNNLDYKLEYYYLIKKFKLKLFKEIEKKEDINNEMEKILDEKFKLEFDSKTNTYTISSSDKNIEVANTNLLKLLELLEENIKENVLYNLSILKEILEKEINESKQNINETYKILDTNKNEMKNYEEYSYEEYSLEYSKLKSYSSIYQKNLIDLNETNKEINKIQLKKLLKILSVGEESKKYFKTNKKIIISISMFLGFFVGVFLSFFIEFIKNTNFREIFK